MGYGYCSVSQGVSVLRITVSFSDALDLITGMIGPGFGFLVTKGLIFLWNYWSIKYERI